MFSRKKKPIKFTIGVIVTKVWLNVIASLSELIQSVFDLIGHSLEVPRISAQQRRIHLELV